MNTKRIITAALFAAVASGASAQQPVIWWDFDAGVNTVNKGSGGATYNPVFADAPTFTADRHGNIDRAIFFTGNNTNDFISTPYTATPSQTMTMWFNIQGGDGTTRTILRFGNGNNSLTYWHGQRYLNCNNRNANYQNVLPSARLCTEKITGEWIFLTTTRDADTGECAIYIDGQLTDRKTSAIAGFQAPGTGFYIGGTGNPGDAKIDRSYIADIKIYETCLPYERVRELYAEATGTPPAGNLLAYLPLDGTAEDIANHNPVVIKGAPGFIPAKVGQGASFTPAVLPPPSNSGGNAYIAVSNVIGSAGTITLWYYHNETTPYTLTSIFDNAAYTESWRLWLEGTRITFRRGNRDYHIVSSEFKPDEWQHIALTWDRNTMIVYLYLDGTPSKHDDLFRADPDPTLYLGSFNANNGAANGIWDEVRVYDYILTAEEVEDIYNGTNIYTPPSPPGTIIILR